MTVQLSRVYPELCIKKSDIHPSFLTSVRWYGTVTCRPDSMILTFAPRYYLLLQQQLPLPRYQRHSKGYDNTPYYPMQVFFSYFFNIFSLYYYVLNNVIYNTIFFKIFIKKMKHWCLAPMFHFSVSCKEIK